MPKVFGTPDRCIWCNSKEMANRREFEFREAPGKELERMFVCSEACEGDLRKFERKVRRGRRFFIAAAIGMPVASIVGVILAITITKYFLYVGAVGLTLLGAVLWLFPFATPDTMERIGIRQATRVARVAGLVLLLMGHGAFLGIPLIPKL